MLGYELFEDRLWNIVNHFRSLIENRGIHPLVRQHTNSFAAKIGDEVDPESIGSRST